MMMFKIDPEMQALIPPLAPDELATLEASIVEDGCRDALVVWQEDGILLDGHNRYDICERNGIEYQTREISLPDREAALDWMDKNQIGRRNLSPDSFRLILGRIYNRTKKAQGGTGANQFKQIGQNEPSATAETLAEKHSVSPATVKRAGKLAEAAQEAIQEEPEITAKGEKEILRRAKEIQAEKRQKRLTEVKERLESVEAQEAKAAEGLYDVIVIDPPWPMQKIERDVTPNQVAFEYPTMSLEDIARVKIPAADSAHIWLWTTHKFMPPAFDLFKTWGVKYICLFVWHKNGGFQPFGLPQFNCEFALYGRIGSPSFVDTKAFLTCFNADRGKHSEKPEEFYEVLRRVTAGRRLDMFNRRRIDGFDGYGNESPNEL